MSFGRVAGVARRAPGKCAPGGGRCRRAGGSAGRRRAGGRRRDPGRLNMPPAGVTACGSAGSSSGDPQASLVLALPEARFSGCHLALDGLPRVVDPAAAERAIPRSARPDHVYENGAALAIVPDDDELSALHAEFPAPAARPAAGDALDPRPAARQYVTRGTTGVRQWESG